MNEGRDEQLPRRGDDDAAPEGEDAPAEGVRLLRPEEAAANRAAAALRPRAPQDRPSTPPSRPAADRPTGPPALSFPLPMDTDPASIERPAVAPARRSLFGRTEEELAAERLTGAVPADVTSELRLPHWTDPPTGQHARPVERATGGEGGGGETADAGSWAGVAATGPRWKDRHDDWDEVDLVGDLADDGVRLGALDTEDRPTEPEIFSFDDEPDEPPAPATAPRFGARSAPDRLAPVAMVPPSAGGRNVPQAAAVGVGLAGSFIALLAWAPVGALVMVTVIVAAAAYEFYESLRTPGFTPLRDLGVLACAALPLAAYWRGTPAIPAVLFITVVAAMAWYLVGLSTSRPVANLGVTLLGVVWIGAFGSYAGLLLRAPDGGGLLFAVALATSVSDVGGFFVGRAYGSTPLSSASPNKTVEGLLGGLLCSIVVTCAVVGIGGIGPFGDGIGRAFLLGLTVSLVAPIGDLAESVIKRDLGVKDMGSVLPGHGGVLDRFDGMLFALPTGWYLAGILGIISTI